MQTYGNHFLTNSITWLNSGKKGGERKRMPNLVLTLGIAVAALAIAAVIYGVLARRGPHWTSRLTCPKCGKTFDYNWLPGGSFSAVRMGKKRYLSCPLCHEWSTFDIWSTRIKAEEKPEKT
jgi:hypothetical protein